MNGTSGRFHLNTMAGLCDTTLITILTAILSVSIILALLLIIPATFQFMGSLITKRANVVERTGNPQEAEVCLEMYQIDMYRYRIFFNFSVFLIVTGSTIPLLTRLINVRHMNKGHIKIDETNYEYFVSIWGVCHLMKLLDIGGRIFFAMMITIPTILISAFFIMKKTRLDQTFRIILILSALSFIFAYASPGHLLANLWTKTPIENDSYYYCMSQGREIFYARLQLFELLTCHLLPVLIIVPSIAYTWFNMNCISMDVFYEPIIFVIANLPLLVLDIMEQISISNHNDLSGSERFANFYLVVLTFYHMSYTGMFLVAPIQSMIRDDEDFATENREVSNVYQVLIKKESFRKTLRIQRD